MADEEIKETEEITEEPVIDDGGKPDEDDKDGVKPNTEDMPNSSGKQEEDKGGIVRKIMDKLPSFGGKKEEVAEETDELDILDEFTKVAKEQGWTDKEIIDFTSDYRKDGASDEELKEMIPFLLEEEEPEEPKKTSATDLETPNADGKPIPKDKVEALKEEIRKEFQAEIKELKESKAKTDEVQEAQKATEMKDGVNRAFDEMGKVFKVFGKTDKLAVFPAGPKKGQYVPTSPEMKARSEVYAKAFPYIQAGIPVKDAMKVALTWYKGEYLEADIKRNLIKDLKKSEKKLSAKRTSKETIQSFEDEEDYRRNFILKEAEKRGMKLVDE